MVSWPTGSSLWQAIAARAYWKPVNKILGRFLDVLVVKAQRLMSGAGRKMDGKDPE